MGMPRDMRGRYMPGRGLPADMAGRVAPPPQPTDPNAAAQAGANTNGIILVCRAVSLTSVDSSANPSIAYAVESEIKNSPLVDPKATQLSANISPDDANGTFTFTVNVTLLNPPNF